MSKPAHNSEEGTPLYASLAKHLTDGIRSGQYPVGSMLPTEAELAEQFSISRQTVREALRRLDDLGLVSRRRGIGTRVQSTEADARYTLAVDSLSDLVEYARKVRLSVDTIEAIEVSGRLAERIGCRDGSRWLQVQGRRYATADQDTPVGIVQMFIRAGYPAVEERLRNLDGSAVHAMLEEQYGEQIGEIRQEVLAVAIGPDEARVLAVPPGSPGLEIHRRFFGRGGRVVMVGSVVYPGHKFRYSGRFLRDRRE